MTRPLDAQRSIGTLFTEGIYVVPMYQRNYAWDEGEIGQLIQDLRDQMKLNGDYYLGTLIVDERQQAGHRIFEIIDSQQRLTTLALIVATLRATHASSASVSDGIKLEFECRPDAQQTLRGILSGRDTFEPMSALGDEQQGHGAILNGLRIVKRHLGLMTPPQQQSFGGFLLERTQIIRISVPAGTNLNHYFEVMNNRGQQLEKHEVLKARMLNALRDFDPDGSSKVSRCFADVWDACANLDRYVQQNFSNKQRTRLFGAGWDQFEPNDFAGVLSTWTLEAETATGLSEPGREEDLVAIVSHPFARGQGDAPGQEEGDERFSSIINFPNFLLQVLKLQVGRSATLDDKQLLTHFKEHILEAPDPAKRVLEFGFLLLKARFLFDQYIIKRDSAAGEKWSLLRLRCTEKQASACWRQAFAIDDSDASDVNERVLMLQAAFHVSAPAMLYKYWLAAALAWLAQQESGAILGEAYLRHLELVARRFLFERYLAPGDGKEYDVLIAPTEGSEPSREIFEQRLSYDKIQNNFVFNYLDYLLWVTRKAGDPVVQQFHFTQRSSVEHHYPQTPYNGVPLESSADLHAFGNLCLLRHDENSRLSNLMPGAKCENYPPDRPGSSLKHYLMRQYKAHWNAETIRQHGDEMKELLAQGAARA